MKLPDALEQALVEMRATWREDWEREQLESLRNDETMQAIAVLIASHDHGPRTALQIANEIVDYLTTPQLKVSNAQD